MHTVPMMEQLTSTCLFGQVTAHHQHVGGLWYGFQSTSAKPMHATLLPACPSQVVCWAGLMYPGPPLGLNGLHKILKWALALDVYWMCTPLQKQSKVMDASKQRSKLHVSPDTTHPAVS